MKNLLFSLTLLVAATVNAQDTIFHRTLPPPPEENIDDAQIFSIVEEMPEFPGGQAEMMKFISKNVRYPQQARDCDCQGTVFASFVIAEDGTVTDPKIVRGVNCDSSITYYDKKGNELPESQKDIAVTNTDCGAGAKELANETIKVINAMPKWTVGKQNGKPVRVLYNLPIKFALQ